MAARIDKIGKVKSESVEKGTGKNWSQWMTILENAGGWWMTHQELVALVKKKYRLSLWWQQGVVTGYEMYIGRKIEGRNAKGEYATVASRTFPLGQKNLWKFLESKQPLWLKPLARFDIKAGQQFEVEGGIFGEVRTLKKPERMRLRWQDEDWAKASVVQVSLIPRPGEKSILVFQHDKLPHDRVKTDYNNIG